MKRLDTKKPRSNNGCNFFTCQLKTPRKIEKHSKSTVSLTTPYLYCLSKLNSVKSILHGTYVPFISNEYWTLPIFEHNNKSAYKTPKIRVQHQNMRKMVIFGHILPCCSKMLHTIPYCYISPESLLPKCYGKIIYSHNIQFDYTRIT